MFLLLVSLTHQLVIADIPCTVDTMIVVINRHVEPTAILVLHPRVVVELFDEVDGMLRDVYHKTLHELNTVHY